MPQFYALEKPIILTHTVVRPPYECKSNDVFSPEAELKRRILTCSWYVKFLHCTYEQIILFCEIKCYGAFYSIKYFLNTIKNRLVSLMM
jgi:hypothetical protein